MITSLGWVLVAVIVMLCNWYGDDAEDEQVFHVKHSSVLLGPWRRPSLWSRILRRIAFIIGGN